MVKKIIFISFSVFIMSCSAIGRGILIDSILRNVHKELEQEKKDENEKKQNSQSKPAIEENTENNPEEDDDQNEEIE
ncbi:hypothetical protein QIA17_00470 (plasmid) [Borreliella californiensis]|uniref:Lipoprotein n=1 Tax=Borreliella californiensis TaxID=373543 RepID=A0A7X0DPP4_9SPIR|nr:hypothetical protein [Borreliella californiensis]MBB6213408.1 hypothetical protein [Borreliella californiensis]MBB6213433.1 hypothetical protein [Borreliella californiensis]WKC91313.1 hypothetical protein QIA17_00470 [Borreliella californiensis]WNY70973.1 hypothetical protein QIA39_04715 [Borreliella californiensis]